MIKCPWCGKDLSDYKYPAKHIRTACKYIPQNLTKVEIIDKAFNTISGYSVIELINDYNNLFSLPDLSKKYKISYNFIQDILKLHNIKLRNISESAKKITSKKVKETCLKNYGVNNPSQLNYVKEKKKQTFIKHYGVDNIWKTEEYKNFTRERWNNYSNEEKTNALKGFIDKHRGTISKLEKRVLSILKDLQIDFTSQYRIGKYFHKYDIRICKTKILIEINGDFWHANPKLFKETDILNFSKTNHPIVKDIWEKDKKNKEYAEKHGYKVIYLWENDITDISDIELSKILITKLNE